MKNVSGPVVYKKIVIHDVVPKVIHLFGDIHQYYSECKQQDTTIIELIHNTLLTTNEIDLFVENANGGYVEKEIIQQHLDKGHHTKESDGYLNETIDFFSSEYNCFIHPIQDYCTESFPTHRFHNIDYRFFLYEQIQFAWTNLFGWDDELLKSRLDDENLSQEEHNEFIEKHSGHLSPIEKIYYMPGNEGETRLTLKLHEVWYLDEIQPEIIKKVVELIHTHHIRSLIEFEQHTVLGLLVWMDYLFEKIVFNFHPSNVILLPKERFFKDLLDCFSTFDTSKKEFIENTQQITFRMREKLRTLIELPLRFNYCKDRLYKSINACPDRIQDVLRHNVDELWNTFVSKRNEYKDKSIYTIRIDLTPLFSYLMDHYVVIRLCKLYITKCICYVGVAHVKQISELLESVYQDQFHSSIFYGDISIINNVDREVVQCVRIPLTDTIPPLLEFSEFISLESNVEQEFYDYFSIKDRSLPQFMFEFKNKSYKRKPQQIIVSNGIMNESLVLDQLDSLFKKYSKHVDSKNSYEVGKSFRSLIHVLHPDKTIHLPSKERNEKEQDLKTFVKLLQQLGYKGTKTRSKKSKGTKTRSKSHKKVVLG